MAAKQLLPLSGVAAVLLIIAAFAIGGETPEADDSVGSIVAFYEDNDTDLQIASGLLALGGFFFLLFSTTLADMFRRARPDRRVASNLALAGGILFAVGTTIFSGIEFAAAEYADDIDPSSIQTLSALSNDMFFTLAAGVGAFLLGAGVAAVKSEILPRWLAWAAIVIGVVALTPGGFFAFLALGIWTLIVSVMLAMRAGDSRDTSPPRDTAPPTAP
jgi:hypothetical protein